MICANEFVWWDLVEPVGHFKNLPWRSRFKGDLSSLIWYNNYVLIWGDRLSCDPHMIANHPIYGVIGYHVTLSEGHMIANHPI